MAKTRLPYAAEFRRQMVELVRAGRTPEELATEFEPTAQSIRNWVAQSNRNAGRGDGGLTTAEREELRAVSGLAESGFPREAEGRSLQHRFGFVRVPWPDPIRRICANAW
jgi:transposase-like protein